VKGLLYYRTHIDDAQNIGIVQKCKHFATSLSEHGIETDSIYYSENGLVNSDRVTLSQSVPIGSTPKHTLKHAFHFYFFIDKYLRYNVNWLEYDFIIIRHMPMHPNFFRLLKYLKSKHSHLKIIIDFPTFPYHDELNRGIKGKVLAQMDVFFRKKLKKYVDIALYNGNIDEIYGIKVIKVLNGIGLDGLESERILPDFSETLNVVFAGNISEWHGVDRAIYGLAQYLANYKPKDIRILLKIIGHGSSLKKLQELAIKLGLTDNVIFILPKKRDELQFFFNEAHLALGSLGLHRIGLNEATPLKHREYCAVGLPFVFAGEDEDFGQGFDFALKVKADESPINWAEIVEFYKKTREKYPYLRLEMQKFTSERLTWEKKVFPLIEYLKKNLHPPFIPHIKH
jgi:glycosyltransferase involved in cell wall biosynthesis